MSMIKTEHWKPSAPMINLWKRASILAKIRGFFSDRDIIEVNTPSMSQTTTTDIHLVPFQTHFIGPTATLDSYDLWLRTSPEYHMKRLLAAGSGAIYQLGYSFRNKEVGRYHNPEFTMLEWYRPYYDMYLLMNEVNVLLQLILKYKQAQFVSYRQVFIDYLDIDPLSCNKYHLYTLIEKLGEKQIISGEEEHDTLLQLLFMLAIQSKIGLKNPIFIYHFPKTQAELAKINSKDHRIAERFEVYYKGIELANGSDELTDRYELQHRLEQNNLYRSKKSLPQYPIDTYLIESLAHGNMPDCSGVAIGIDRLIMLALNAGSLNDVIAFPIDRC
ncbi:PoxA protein [Candidatus Pantoea carbekii]|uniref:PoxA protein n=1 Tax=Candidatus Pantoea carbekii TaxID=1235990 RepID=U3U7E4_9GAMM|nr:PoxA protein [Candidatus Pantoea carbekii]